MGEVLFFGKEPQAVNPHYPKKRLLHVMLEKGMHRPKVGVYQLLFNDHYYIGRSKDIRARVKQHMKELELLVNNTNPKDNAQRKMLKYLREHPTLSILKVKILDECPESDLVERESFWLQELGYDDKCLNATLNALVTARDVARQEFKEGEYVVTFKVSTFEHLLRCKKIASEYNAISHGYSQ